MVAAYFFCAHCRIPFQRGMLAVRMPDGYVLHAQCYWARFNQYTNNKIPQYVRDMPSMLPRYPVTHASAPNKLTPHIPPKVTPFRLTTPTGVTPFPLGQESAVNFTVNI